MMDAASIIKQLVAQKIMLSESAGELVIKAPKGVLTPLLIDLIKNNKPALIDYLQHHVTRGKSRLPAMTQVARRDNASYLTSFAQQRLWFIDRLEEGSAHYNMPLALRVEGRFDVAVAEQAMSALIRRHEPLRTVFQEQGDTENSPLTGALADHSGPVQVIREALDFHFTQHDLSALSSAQQTAEVARLMAQHASQAFDLTSDLMIRASFLSLSQEADNASGVLLFNMHHIASDGWSMGVLSREFVALYDSFSKGAENPLPALEIQYLDYAHWQRQWLQGEVLEAQLDYWKKQLQEVPAVHSLPLDFPRPAFKGHQGGLVSAQLPQELTQRLQAIAQQESATLFMLLHAALSLVLARHSNSNDMVIGVPVANRLHRQLEPLIGFFVNTLVLRTRHDFATFKDYLDHVKQVNLDAQAHQDVPVDHLVEVSNLVRSTAHTPLFQIVFSMDNNEEMLFDLPGLRFSALQGDTVVAKFDLEISAQLTPEGLDWQWLYDKELFTQAHIEQLNDHVQRVLFNIAQSPQGALSALSMLSTAQVHQLTQQLNQTQQPALANRLLHQWFEEEAEKQAQRNPYKLALVCGDQSLSYQALNQAANQLAHYLRDQGVMAESLVGLYVEPSLHMVIAILAILKAGGAYVPLDPSYPQDRLVYMLRDTQLKHLLTQTRLAPSLADWSLADDLMVTVLDNEKMHQQLAVYSTHNLACSAEQTRHSLAYVIYTSGSTGQPKGVAVEQKGLLNLLHWYVKAYQFDDNSRFLIISSMGFDLTQKNIFAPLILGGCLVLRAQSHYDPEQILRTIETQKITTINCAPSVFYPLIEQAQGQQYRALQSLTRVLFGGEPIQSAMLSPWLSHRACNALINNMYGPTECTDIATQCEYLGVGNDIGRPIDNVRLYILDANKQLVPFGVVGELHIAGAGLARGYLHQPELTAQRFIQSTFCDEAAGEPQRLYKTGDLVRYRADGHLEFVGRIDDQVKIRGFRIELGEIEHALNRSDQIKSALVLAREDEPGKPQLVAYLVPNNAPCEAPENASPEAAQFSDSALVADLRLNLKTTLPDYMVPSAFVLLPAFPLTANGKIDKKALPLPDSRVLQGDYVAPTTKTERALVAIWARLLKLQADKLSVTGNFFELGGDSILSIQVVSRAAQVDLHFTVKDLFTAQTIQALARLVKRKTQQLAPQQPVTGKQGLLPIQYEFFSDPVDLHHFNQAFLLTTPMAFSLEALRAMVEQLYRRHDALRLAFVTSPGDHGQGTWQGEYVPLSDAMIDAAVQVKAWHDSQFSGISDYATSVQQSLNIQRAELFKAVYLHAQGEQVQGRLLVVVHHLVMDGVSWRVLLEDMNSLYDQWLRHLPLGLAAKTSSYQQWCQYLSEYAHSASLRKEKAYWLKTYQTPISPFVRPAFSSIQNHGDGLSLCGESLTESAMGCAELRLSATLTRQLLTQSPPVYRTKVNELLLAGILLGAHRWRGARAIRVDLEGHGREVLTERLDLNQTLGWFTSVYPLTLSLDSDDGLADSTIKAREKDKSQLIAAAICAVKEQYRAIPNNGIGFGLLKYIAKDADFVELPVSELVFNYLGQFDQVVNEEMHFGIAPESPGQEISAQRKQSHALSMNGMVIDGQLGFRLTFDAAVYEPFAMQGLMNKISDALADIVEHCASVGQGGYTPSDFPLAHVSKAELSAWQAQVPMPIEDLYPATGMQQGLLFHSLLNASSYVTQTLLSLEDLDCHHFKLAWQQLVARHGVFRTLFVGLNSGNAHQLLLPEVTLPWIEHDLSALDAEQQRAQLDAIRQADKQQGFDPSQAPLMRITLVNLGDQHYQVIWSNHHALIDGWCVPIIFHELAQCYRALRQQRQAPLAFLPPYRDYVRWLSEQNPDEAKAFWQQQLAMIDSATPLPLAQPSTTATTDNSAALITKKWRFSQDQSAQLMALAQGAQTTLNIVLQGAWALLLSRYSGDQRVVFGATTAGRPANLEGVEQMVGLFINSVPVVVDLPDTVSLVDWLKQLHQQQVERESYNHYPLYKIQALAPIKQGLFDSLLVFENYPVEEVDQPLDEAALKIRHIEAFEGTDYGLCLAAHLSDTLEIELSAQAHLFSDDSVSQLSQHLTNLLIQLASLSLPHEKTLAQLDVISSADIHHLVYELNETQVDYASDQLIHELFEQQVQRQPNKVALVFESQQLSYQALNHAANKLAHYLREQGVGADTLVGLCVERSVEMMIGILAILKAGGAYVPLDPNYPAARLHYMLQDTGLAYLLTQSHLTQLVASATQPMSAPELTCIALDSKDTQCLLDRYSGDNLSRTAQQAADNLAYVIYTSGSTGKPKGVMIEHQGAVNLSFAQQDIFHVNSHSHVLQFASLGFDAGVFEWLAALLTGAQLCICPQSVRHSPPLLSEYLRDQAISHALLPPSLLAELPLRDDYSLVALLVGGEACNHSLAKQWLAHYPVFNAYGPSENSVMATVSALQPQQRVNIGRPIANIKALVLSASQTLLPKGAVGELYLGGAGLARGYLNQPELTAERFIWGAFDESTGRFNSAAKKRQLWYKTGDLVRYLADGNLEFIGRVDDQVKIRGFRIELGEIENSLNACANVLSSLVLTREDPLGQPQLVAYVVPDGLTLTAPNAKPAATEDTLRGDLVAQLRERLQTQLPDYMVPSAFVLLEQLPLTANGKIDKSALPLPDRSAWQGRYVAPSTATEKALVEIWARLLMVDAQSLSSSANFFELGGHSLLAVRLIGDIRATLGQEIAIKTIFDYPQLRALAAQLDKGSELALRSAIGVVERDQQRLSLSFAQQRLWYIEQSVQASSQYHIPLAMGVDGDFDVAVAEQAMSRLIARHEPLRTVFVEDQEGPLQVILEACDFHFEYHDLRGLCEPEQSHRLADLMAEHRERQFDLTSDLMIRASYIQLANAESSAPLTASAKSPQHTGVLLLNSHHIASDGWSMGILLNEFFAQYQAIKQGTPLALAPLAIQYVDYALWQRQWFTPEVLQQPLDYWQALLADAPVCHQLPLDKPRQHGVRLGGVISRQCSSDLISQISACLARSSTTLFMLMQAALAVHIGRLSHVTDVVMGSPTAGRVVKEVEPLIGLFLNTQVFRTEFADNPDFLSLLATTKQAHLTSAQYNEVPFELIVDRVNPPRSLDHTPIFQVLINLNNTDSDKLERIAGLDLTPLDQTSLANKYDLTLYINQASTDQGDSLELSWVYDGSLFTADTITSFAEEFEFLLGQMLAHPHTPVLNHPWKNVSLPAFPNVLADYSLPANSIAGLLEYWAATKADSPALVFGKQTDSYGALNQQVNQLAYLLSAGYQIGLGSRVAIATKRHADRVKAILALLKIGACYIPLSEELPAARIRYMLADANASLLITDSAFITAHDWLQNDNLDQAPWRHQTMCLDDDDIIGQWHEQPTHNPMLEAIGKAEVAHIIYTSGSTGNPKGVLGTYGATYNRIAWMLSELPFADNEHVAHLTSMAFIRGVWELLVPLCGGAKLTIFPREWVKQTDLLWSQLNAQGISRIVTTPSLMKALIDHASNDVDPNMGVNSRLQHWFVSGEPLLNSDAQNTLKVLPCVSLYNLYGSTEVMSDVLWSKVSPAHTGYYSPVGKPIGCVQVAVSGVQGQVVPKGIIGELVVYGDCVALGYHHADASASQAFIETSAGRAYRTGDLGRVLKNGEIECLGRIDSQIKIRGFRIELGEIEHKLHEHDGVKSALLMARQDPQGQTQLVAYVVPTSARHSRDFAGELRDHLKTSLPDYMLPWAFVMLESLPLTVNGKVNKKALPSPDISHLQERLYQPPKGQIEKAVAHIWQNLLGVDKVGRHDDFFSLGGHSLLIIQLLNQLKKAPLEARISVRDITAAPTVAAIAKCIKRSKQHNLAPREEAQGAAPGSIIEASATQTWLLNSQPEFRASLYKELLFYVPVGMTLEHIEHTLTILLNHHEGLRWRFFRDADTWWAQITQSVQHYRLEAIDLSHLEHSEEIEQACYGHFLAVSKQLDIPQGPLMKVAYAKLPAGQADRLYFAIHHLVYDGVSLEILFEDFHRVSQALSTGQAPKLERSTSMIELVRWSNDGAQYGKIFAAVKAWLTRNRTAPLPNDFNLDGEQLKRRNTSDGVVRCQSRWQVKNKGNFNLANVCKIALINVLCRWSGNPRVELLLVSALRYEIAMATGFDLSRTIGFISGAKIEILKAMDGSTQQRLLQLHEQLANVPYGGFLNSKEGDQYVDAQGNPVLQKTVHFNFVSHTAKAQEAVNDGLELYADRLLSPTDHPDDKLSQAVFSREEVFNVGVSQQGDQLSVLWLYHRQLHKAQTVQALMADFRQEVLSMLRTTEQLAEQSQ